MLFVVDPVTLKNKQIGTPSALLVGSPYRHICPEAHGMVMIEDA